jgi:hypothetical protein
MQTSSISQIKKELQTLPQERLLELCLAMAKYKKENKEVFDYMLFRAHDEDSYIEMVKEEVAVLFEEINLNSWFFVKKSLRKILRLVNKYSKYSSQKTTTIELLLFFCQQLKASKIDYKSNVTIFNIYLNQIKKIEKEVSKLHEDLQYDYEFELNGL